MIPATDGGPSLTVLIADPHQDGAESLACLLRLYGHEVTTARTGEAALAAADRSPPDVLIVEPRLGGPDGWEVARRLRASVPRPVCIAIRSDGRPEGRRRSAEVGIVAHLLKPAEPDAVIALLARVSRLRSPAALAV